MQIRFLVLPLLLCSCNPGAPEAPAKSQLEEADEAQRNAERALEEADRAAAEADKIAAQVAADQERWDAEDAEIPSGGRPTNPQAENTIKAFINLNSQLCAEIVRVQPLALQNTVEVTCIEYRGGSARVTYVINLESGELQKSG